MTYDLENVIDAAEKFPALYSLFRWKKGEIIEEIFQIFFEEKIGYSIEIYTQDWDFTDEFYSALLDIFSDIDGYTVFMIFLREMWYENKKIVVKMRQAGFSIEELIDMLLYLHYTFEETWKWERSIDEIFWDKISMILEKCQYEEIGNFGYLHQRLYATVKDFEMFPINNYGELTIAITKDGRNYTTLNILNEQVRIQDRTGSILDDCEEDREDEENQIISEEEVKVLGENIPSRTDVLAKIRLLEEIIAYNTWKRKWQISAEASLLENNIVSGFTSEWIILIEGNLENDDYSRNVLIGELQKVRNKLWGDLQWAIMTDCSMLEKFAQTSWGSLIWPRLIYSS